MKKLHNWCTFNLEKIIKKQIKIKTKTSVKFVENLLFNILHKKIIASYIQLIQKTNHMIKS